jgi:hypothetical protein
MINLYSHILSFTHNHEYIYDSKMYAVIFAVTQQITMEYAGNAFSEARGKWKCPWNLPTLVINQYFKQRAVTALKPGRIPLHMQEKMYKTCACKGIGDLHATHSITVCTI